MIAKGSKFFALIFAHLSLQRVVIVHRAAAAAAVALMRTRMERSDFAGMANPGSRQIYLTFPADSTFTEEDVSNYFRLIVSRSFASYLSQQLKSV